MDARLGRRSRGEAMDGEGQVVNFARIWKFFPQLWPANTGKSFFIFSFSTGKAIGGRGAKMALARAVRGFEAVHKTRSWEFFITLVGVVHHRRGSCSSRFSVDKQLSV